MRNGTDPAAVTIGGYDGSVRGALHARRPRLHDLPPGRLPQLARPFRSATPGQVDLLWIVDVDGQRITFDVSYPPTATPEQVAELKDIVTTATFTRREGT